MTDEYAQSGTLDALLRELAVRCVDASNRRYIKPMTYLGVGGTKIFRDEIWGPLRFPFVADHQFYKSKGLYDFPQKDYANRLRNLIFNVMIKIPTIRKEIYGNQLMTKMLEPFKKLLLKASFLRIAWVI